VECRLGAALMPSRQHAQLRQGVMQRTRPDGVVEWAMTSESLEKLLVTFFRLIVELSYLAHAVRASVYSTRPGEHPIPVPPRPCGTGQRTEAMGRGFESAIRRVHTAGAIRPYWPR
jgi:hypothetical protein